MVIIRHLMNANGALILPMATIGHRLHEQCFHCCLPTLCHDRMLSDAASTSSPTPPPQQRRFCQRIGIVAVSLAADANGAGALWGAGERGDASEALLVVVVNCNG